VVASTVDVEAEESVASKQDVNAGSYVSFHNGQMFEDGLSFSGFERNKVWINTGEAFADLSNVSGSDTPNDSRAVVAADFDDDGDADLFVHSIQRERHGLYRNDILEPGTGAGFLKIRLRATTGQHEAIGAIVTVDGPAGSVSQVMSRGAGFLSCQVPELIFGLGGKKQAAVSVRWPGGDVESFGSVAANATLRLVEGAGRPEHVERLVRPLPDPMPPGLALEEGEVLPRLAVADAGGEPTVLDVAQLSQGKPVLLNFWASYCAPCVAELPLLQRRHEEGELSVIALSVDVLADRETARAQLEAVGAEFPVFFLAQGGRPPEGAEAIDALIDLDRLSLPTSLALFPEGRLESILRGPLQEE
jgi:thiol-disulfide isomerase/thioredoxin